MKLIIINGSPRGKNSNSTLLTEKFVDGFNSVNNDTVDITYLARKSERENISEKLINYDSIIMVFPLYTDCMPGIVMEFFENITKNKYLKNKRIGYIIHSGFPESKHSIYLERYLEKLTSRLQFDYLGTIIKGGSEGLRIMSQMMTKKIFSQFHNLGKVYAETGLFDNKISAKLRVPFTFSKSRLKLFKLISKTGITNFYWNMNLKKNNVLHLKDNKPYIN